MRENGSPEPKFLTGDDYTYFEVELFIHPEFSAAAPVDIELNAVRWHLQGIDHLLNLLLEKTWGDIASNQDELTQSINIQPETIIERLNSNQAGTIAGDIAGGIAEKQKTILEQCIISKSREEVLKAIKLSNQRKNYVEQMLPLVELEWLAMTIPHKPTSPHQKYLITLKGRLVLEFLSKWGSRN